MKAFIMAAGIGTRLRPLTYAIPKPLVPIVNIPVIGHLMYNLAKHNINNIVVNLHYYPNMITSYLCYGENWNVKIKYSFEKKLLGTAGGVKFQEKFFDKTFIVTSGDGLSDINFSKLIKFHKEKKALATVVLKPIDARFDYGVVVLDQNNLIKNFYEKPSWGEIFSNLVNTGIYVFEPEVFKYIPKNKFYDFGHNLLPKLINKSLPVYGYVTNEYWCDVGNLSEYRKAQRDCLDGRVNVKIPGKEVKKKIWVGKNARLHKTLKISPPCVIGNNVVVGENCIFDSYTVIGNNCMIGNNVKIKDSVLWDKVVVSSNVHLNSCVIGSNAKVSESITMFDGTIINIEI